MAYDVYICLLLLANFANSTVLVKIIINLRNFKTKIIFKWLKSLIFDGGGGEKYINDFQNDYNQKCIMYIINMDVAADKCMWIGGLLV